jgi:2,4-dichlorophenol 6-monooxygenase
VSTLDLAGKGRFCLLTGIAGEEWADAAAKAAEELGVEIVAHVIGPGREYIDLYDDWARVREVEEDGCVLARPDAYVAWRSAGIVEDPAVELHRVLCAVLARG